MKPFSVEHQYWTLFLDKYASISDKIQQQIISKEDDVCICLLCCLKRHAGYQGFNMAAHSHYSPSYLRHVSGGFDGKY